MLQDSTILANQLSAELLEQFGGLEDIILFGSTARGDNNIHSDIDLLIVMDKIEYNINDISAKYDARVEALVKYGQSINYGTSNKKYHILYCHKGDLNDDSHLIQNIKKDGISLT